MTTAAHGMALLRCADCGRLDSPGRIVCAGCLSEKLEAHVAEGEGTVATFTTIRRAPGRFRDDAPYDVVVVDLDCGVRVTGRLQRDSAPATVGARARAVSAGDTGAVFTVVG